MTQTYDLIVIGGGPAGLAAALAAWDAGVRDILILERDKELGGILNQCIHNGFGLTYFKEELTGPEYAGRFIERLKETDIEVKTDTMVLSVSESKQVHAVNAKDGWLALQAKSVIFTMGCRERTRGAIGIPGDRPAGVLTAGAAQRYLNIEGYMVGKRVVILGSGDIGLIMARRMTLEGAKVLAVVELMPYSNGLNRNIVQCLHDYDIPLYLAHTITDINGKNGRIEQVQVAAVDENRQPVPGTEITFDCDTLLLSVGLIPENELSKAAGIVMDGRTNGPVVFENMETSIPGVFACGNVVHVHDLVDFVTAESIKAGTAAARYLKEEPQKDSEEIALAAAGAATYTVPQKIRKSEATENVQIFFRVNRVMEKATVQLKSGENLIAQYKKEHMAPGEMGTVTLPAKLLATAKESITLTVLPNEEKTTEKEGI